MGYWLTGWSGTSDHKATILPLDRLGETYPTASKGKDSIFASVVR